MNNTMVNPWTVADTWRNIGVASDEGMSLLDGSGKFLQFDSVK